MSSGNQERCNHSKVVEICSAEEEENEVSKVLDLAGVSKEQYSDADTWNVILSFINNDGGLEFIKESKPGSTSESSKDLFSTDMHNKPPAQLSSPQPNSFSKDFCEIVQQNGSLPISSRSSLHSSGLPPPPPSPSVYSSSSPPTVSLPLLPSGVETVAQDTSHTAWEDMNENIPKQLKVDGISEKHCSDSEKTKMICSNDLNYSENFERFMKVSEKPIYTSGQRRRKSRNGNFCKKPSLTHDDIGLPKNFIHLQHVSFDARRGFYATPKADVEAKIIEYLNLDDFDQKEYSSSNPKITTTSLYSLNSVSKGQDLCGAGNKTATCETQSSVISQVQMKKCKSFPLLDRKSVSVAKSKKRLPIKKDDIGYPCNFTHVMHVGASSPPELTDIDTSVDVTSLKENLPPASSNMNFESECIRPPFDEKGYYSREKEASYTSVPLTSNVQLSETLQPCCPLSPDAFQKNREESCSTTLKVPPSSICSNLPSACVEETTDISSPEPDLIYQQQSSLIPPKPAIRRSKIKKNEASVF